MYSYKTIVTDYEGMQEALSVYGAQGWKLISVTPDTWRVVPGNLSDADTLGLGTGGPVGPNTPNNEYSASYYLLVLEREGEVTHAHGHAVAAEALDMPDFSLPEY